MAEESPDSSRTELPYTERSATGFSGLTTGIQPRSGITPADLPESWGGRPTGTSRRAIRMQKEWDDQRKREIEDYNIQRQAYENDRTYGLQMREQMLREADYQRKQEEAVANQKLQAQARLESANILSAINRLDPRSQDFESQVAEIMANNPLGTTDEAVQKTLGQYSAASQVYRQAEESRQRKQEQQSERNNQLLRDASKLAALTGKSVNDFAYSDKETGKLVVDPIKLGQMEAEAARKPSVDASTLRQEAKEIRGKIRDIDSEILDREARVGGEKEGSRKQVELQTELNILKAQRNALTLDLDGVNSALSDSGVGGGGGQSVDETQPQIPTLSAGDKAAYDALPEGAEFIVNGRLKRKPIRSNQGQAEPSPAQVEEQAQEPAAAPQPEPQARTEQPVQRGSDVVAQRQAERKPIIDQVREIGSDSMARDMEDIDMLEEELDLLNRRAYRFSQSKRQRDLYASVAKALADSKKSKNAERKRIIAEKRKRMREIGPFSGSEEFNRLMNEVELLSNV